MSEVRTMWTVSRDEWKKAAIEVAGRLAPKYLGVNTIWPDGTTFIETNVPPEEVIEELQCHGTGGLCLRGNVSDAWRYRVIEVTDDEVVIALKQGGEQDE